MHQWTSLYMTLGNVLQFHPQGYNMGRYKCRTGLYDTGLPIVTTSEYPRKHGRFFKYWIYIFNVCLAII